MPKLSIRWRMLLSIALPTFLIYVLVLGVTLSVLQERARSELKHSMTLTAEQHAAQFDGYLREAAALADATARFLEVRPDLTDAEAFAILRANTSRHPIVYGAAIAFAPDGADEGANLRCPYVHRRPDGSLVQMNIGREQYDWAGDPAVQWWHTPTSTGQAIWTDTYFDTNAGNILMVTYAVPFEADDGTRGVTTVDISIPTLRDIVGKKIIGDGLFYVLSRDGTFVYHNIEGVIGQNVFARAAETGRKDVAQLADDVTGGRVGIAAIKGVDGVHPDGARVWISYAPIPSASWGFAAEVDERTALAELHQRFVIGAAALSSTIVLIIATIWLMSGRIARPILRLNDKVQEISSGNLEAQADGAERSDEIGELARSFNKMTAELRHNLDHLASERAARERIQADLSLAREIQQGLLPTTPPDVPGYDIAGWNQPADETGGDYFDWLQLPDGRVVLTLADVTGHGIGPALIVAVCRAYMRAASSSESLRLSEVLRRVNDLLYDDIPAARFVTAAVGLLDPSRGTLDFISAGQGPILFYEAATQTLHNWRADIPPLAVATGLEFPDPRVIEMQPGDMLVLTTDGFFEWNDGNGEMYGVERLEAFVPTHADKSSQEFIKELHRDVRAFVGTSPQNDDLTAVVVKRT